jgi:hypothetical protein
MLMKTETILMESDYMFANLSDDPIVIQSLQYTHRHFQEIGWMLVNSDICGRRFELTYKKGDERILVGVYKGVRALIVHFTSTALMGSLIYSFYLQTS